MIAGGRLEARSITKRFGGLLAVDDVSLTVEPGRITALIGPNGAGKTTLFNCLTGMLTPEQGRVRLDGEDVTDASPDQRARLGIGRTFQRLEVFTGMTVFDNLLVASEMRRRVSLWRGLAGFERGRDASVSALVEETLHRLGIADLADAPAGDLPTGQLRLVEIGRALCTQPKVLLLDEPASGQDAGETARLQELLVELADDGLTILLVEHDVELVMNVSDVIYVLEFGGLIAVGEPGEISSNEAVRAAYLGVEEGAGAAAAGA